MHNRPLRDVAEHDVERSIQVEKKASTRDTGRSHGHDMARRQENLAAGAAMTRSFAAAPREKRNTQSAVDRIGHPAVATSGLVIGGRWLTAGSPLVARLLLLFEREVPKELSAFVARTAPAAQPALDPARFVHQRQGGGSSRRLILADVADPAWCARVSAECHMYWHSGLEAIVVSTLTAAETSAWRQNQFAAKGHYMYCACTAHYNGGACPWNCQWPPPPPAAAAAAAAAADPLGE